MDFNLIKIDEKKPKKTNLWSVSKKKKNSDLILNTNENIWFLRVYIVEILPILHAVFYKFINFKRWPQWIINYVSWNRNHRVNYWGYKNTLTPSAWIEIREIRRL